MTVRERLRFAYQLVFKNEIPSECTDIVWLRMKTDKEIDKLLDKKGNKSVEDWHGNEEAIESAKIFSEKMKGKL